MKLYGKRLRKGRCIAVLVMIFAIFTLCGNAFNANAINKTSDQQLQAIYVKPGDTLWSLVNEKYSFNGDIRKAINDVKRINSLEDSNLQVGDIIYLPI